MDGVVVVDGVVVDGLGSAGGRGPDRGSSGEGVVPVEAGHTRHRRRLTFAPEDEHSDPDTECDDHHDHEPGDEALRR